MRRMLSILVGSGLIFVGACAKTSDEKLGQLMLTLQTDMAVPKDIDSVRIEVRSFGMLQFASDLTLGSGGLKLPATLGVVAGKDPTAPVNIRVIAFQNSVPRVLREVVTTVPSDRVATLPIGLNWLCAGERSVKQDIQGEVQSTCPTNQTCIAGSCGSVETQSEQLKDYTEAEIFGGGTAEGEGKCFDLSACFATTFPVPAMQPNCRMTIPQGQGTSAVNFGLRSQNGGAGVCGQNGCVVPLDFGGSEGWSVQGTELVFPKAVCDVAQLGVELVGAQGCPSKVASMPTCGPWSSVSGQVVGVVASVGTGTTPMPTATQPMGPPATTTMPPAAQEQIMDSGFQVLGSIGVNRYGVYWVGERSGMSEIYSCGLDSCGPGSVRVFSGPGKVLAMALTSGSVVFSHQSSQGSGGAIMACPLPGGCSNGVMPTLIASTLEPVSLLAASETDVFWREPTQFLTCPISRSCGAAARVLAMEPQLVGDLEVSEGNLYWSEPMTGEVRFCRGLECLGGPQGFGSQIELPTQLSIAGGHVYWLSAGIRVMDCPFENCGGQGLTIYQTSGVSAVVADGVDVFVADQIRSDTWQIAQVVRSQPPSPSRHVWSGPSATLQMATNSSRIYFTSADGNVRRVARPTPAAPGTAPAPNSPPAF